MFAPITSQITIETGTVLKELATGDLYKVGRRIQDYDSAVLGDPTWELFKIKDTEQEKRILGYLELTEKFVAQMNE